MVSIIATLIMITIVKKKLNELINKVLDDINLMDMQIKMNR